MTTKLIIDLSRGLIEVEGSEAFVEKIYQDFRAQISANNAPITTTRPTKTDNCTQRTKNSTSKTEKPNS